MRVNLNITFPALHCNDVHLDVIDVAGDSQLEISDSMFKQRLSIKDGSPRSTAKIAAEANIKAEEDKKYREAVAKKIPENYCGPCYGAHAKEGDCCNTCDDVLSAYKKKRWNENAVQPLAEQCIREGRGKNEPKKMTGGEGCNLSGHFTVNRVAGNFHIAMGEGVDREGRHIHQFLPEDRINFNASHVVHELSFMDDDYGEIQKIVDENGDLPLHLLLRNGEAVEQVTTFYAIILLLLAIFFFAKFKYQGKTKKHFPPSRSAELFIKPYSSIFIAAVFLASFTSGQINNANDYVSIC